MVNQMNRWILVQSGFIGSFDLLWSKWSRITSDPDPDHPKGTHPKTILDSGFHAMDSSPETVFRILCQWNLDSGFQSLVGSRIPWVVYSGIQCPGFQIPSVKLSRIPESGFPYKWGDLACIVYSWYDQSFAFFSVNLGIFSPYSFLNIIEQSRETTKRSYYD